MRQALVSETTMAKRYAKVERANRLVRETGEGLVSRVSGTAAASISVPCKVQPTVMAAKRRSISTAR